VSPHALRPKPLENFLLGGGKIGSNAQKEVSKIRKYYEATFGRKNGNTSNPKGDAASSKYAKTLEE